jgi:hypothetical protein
MSEIGTSVGVRKESWPKLTKSEYRRWVELKGIRRIIGFGVLAAVLILGVEAISSYVLFRHFANLHRSFYPNGSATVALFHRLVVKASGRQHDEVALSIDHGPLFRFDKELGYTLYPGKYRITEKRDGLSHRFNLTVNERGERITADQPNGASRHLYVAGDSAMFGWGLDDEQTIPWLLQTRFPHTAVVNLSLTSYSTLHSLLQLRQLATKITADDVVLLTYHPITNEFNVASREMVKYLRAGFEYQLGDKDLVRDRIVVPYGSLDSHGKLVIAPYSMACGQPGSAPAGCPQHPTVSASEATLVTQRAFDAVLAAQPGHVAVAWISGSDVDPVILHLKSKGVLIADLRTADSDPDALDEVAVDEHAGPFWHRLLAERLDGALRSAGLLN